MTRLDWTMEGQPAWRTLREVVDANIGKIRSQIARYMRWFREGKLG